MSVTENEREASVQRVFALARGLIDALYSGMPGQVKPATDSGILYGVADWLDRADDAADAFLAAHGQSASSRDRSVQIELRRIARQIEAAATSAAVQTDEPSVD